MRAIKASTIMVGDYVNVLHPDNTYVAKQVCSITKNKIGYHWNNKPCGNLSYARIGEFKGIELTDEILQQWAERVEQYKDVWKKYIIGSNIMIYPGTDTNEQCDIVVGKFNNVPNYKFSYSDLNIQLNMNVQYVHEVQHALRMCGQEDLANNLLNLD